MSDIDREQTAQVLTHLCDTAQDDILRTAVRSVAEALRGNGLVILSPELIGMGVPPGARDRFQVRPEWQLGEFDQAVEDAIKRLRPTGRI